MSCSLVVAQHRYREMASNLLKAFAVGPGMAINGLFGGRRGQQPDAATSQSTYEALTRQQWADYISTFVPIENQLIEQATDAALPGRAMQAASEDVNASFTAQEGATQRRLTGLGLQLTPEQRAATTRATGLSKSLTDVGAQNMARDLTVQRQQSILGNPAPQGV